MNNLSIGQKVQNFRKRAGISQLELETLIDAAPGSISRIENGKVNPNKETLLDICDALRLPIYERLYVIGANYSQVTTEERELVLEKLASTLADPEFLGYLLDDTYSVLAIGATYKTFLTQLGVDSDKLLGKNMLEIVFNPELGIRSAIPEARFDQIAINLMSFFYKELGFRLNEPWWEELLLRLKTFPRFQELWDSIEDKSINIYAPTSRKVFFKLGDNEIETSYSLGAVVYDPRFTLVEYKPLQK
ncbi:MAG: helix-turn-helix transcriptional regulator [Candidatus Doudnabacteria bacterium]|nr:helix-turn-helix transcriptional regulator [Candidatus Doudnabacteria bacterium]